MKELWKAVDPHLAFFCRYARMLSGRQDAGDYAVARLLDHLVERDGELAYGVPIRAALYRKATEILAELGLIERASAASRCETGLPLVTSLARQAYLLSAVEQLPGEEAAQILEVSQTRLAELASEGARELALMEPVSVLIVEGNASFASRWECWLEALGHSVAGWAQTDAGAIGLAGRHKPGLIVAGTVLRDHSTFAHDTLDRAARLCAAPAVIVSRYPQFSLTGRRVEAAFVIGKSDGISCFDAILRQALFIKRSGLSGYTLPEAASALLEHCQGEFRVIVSTIAARQFAFAAGAASAVYEGFEPSFGEFVHRSGFAGDVDIVSIPHGLVAARSYAKVALRKRPWTSSARFGEIIGAIYRELREPRLQPALPARSGRLW
jgi:hypothetical protein